MSDTPSPRRRGCIFICVFQKNVYISAMSEEDNKKKSPREEALFRMGVRLVLEEVDNLVSVTESGSRAEEHAEAEHLSLVVEPELVDVL